MSVDALVPRVRKALGVSSSYDTDDIPALIRGTINRLLRDYNFPKSVLRTDFTNLLLNSQEYTLPAGFKRELAVQFYDPIKVEWSDPLLKSEGFRRPYPDTYPHHYWLQGLKLITDNKLPSDMVGYTLQLYYQSMLATANEDWITVDFEEAVRIFSVMRGAAEYRKPEIATIYMALWTDERESLAIYLNELEWNNTQIMMREAREAPAERYPAS